VVERGLAIKSATVRPLRPRHREHRLLGRGPERSRHGGSCLRRARRRPAYFAGRQLGESAEEHSYPRMQADSGLVQHIAPLLQIGAQLRGESEALCFSADKVGAERSNCRYPRPTRPRNCNRRGSRPADRVRSGSRGTAVQLEKNSLDVPRSRWPVRPRIDPETYAERDWIEPVSIAGLTGRGFVLIPVVPPDFLAAQLFVESRHLDARAETTVAPACLELNRTGEDRARQSCAAGRARALGRENTTHSDFVPRTWTSPLPKSRARDNAWCTMCRLRVDIDLCYRQINGVSEARQPWPFRSRKVGPIHTEGP